jgi:hypothetical protein
MVGNRDDLRRKIGASARIAHRRQLCGAPDTVIEYDLDRSVVRANGAILRPPAALF